MAERELGLTNRPIFSPPSHFVGSKGALPPPTLQCAILQFVADPRLQLEKFHLGVLMEINHVFGSLNSC
jgi:hypothetical protein